MVSRLFPGMLLFNGFLERLASGLIGRVLFTLLCVLFCCLTYGTPPHRVFGFVYSGEGMEGLPGAHVYLQETRQGVITNNYGFYTLSVSSLPVTIIVSHVGYEPKLFEIHAGGRTDISLTPFRMLSEVEVSARAILPMNESPLMSILSLPATRIQSTPVLLGEKDLFKVLQLMPGVQGGTEGSSGLYVRGGGSDQNLVLLDDAVAYNVNHVFGLFSLFNGDAIKNVQLFKGGFPARYGGRISSVLDISMQEGDLEQYKGELGLGIISSRFSVSGPVSKGRSSFLLSGRRTYHDVWTQRVMLERDKTSYYFYDLNAKTNWAIDAKNRIFLSAYLGRDKMKANDYDHFARNQSGIAWQNALVSLRWNHLRPGGAFSNTALVYSEYDSRIFLLEGSPLDSRKYRMDYHSRVRDFGFRHDWHISLGNQHLLRAGMATTLHVFLPAGIKEKDDFAGIEKENSFYLNALESGLYIEDEFRYQRWMFNAGLRVSQYFHYGQLYVRPEPRLNAAFVVTSATSLKASCSVMNQYMHLSSNTGTGMPTGFWLPATRKLLPQHAVQYALGFTTSPGKSNLEISLEAYYKKMDNVITYSDNASFLLFDSGNVSDPFQDWEENMVQGEAEATGLELLIHRKTGRLNGWIGYTLAFAQNRFEGINNGDWFAADYNRRHDVSLVMSYAFSEKLTLGANWVFSSGRMITLPLQSSWVYLPRPDTEPPFLPGEWHFPADLYGNRNNWKSHNYHRLDVSLQLSKPLKYGTRTWEIGLYNAYNRLNPFQYYIKTDYQTGQRRLMQRTLLPVIPSITYSYRF